MKKNIRKLNKLVSLGLLFIASQSYAGESPVSVGAYLQTGYRTFPNQETVIPEKEFLVRRAYVDVKGKQGKTEIRLLSDVASGTLGLLDAYLDLAFTKNIVLRVGKQKSPNGLERWQSPARLHFNENGLPSALLPNRDVGATLQIKWAGGLSQVGVFNGANDGASLDCERDRGKEIAGRVFINPLLSSEFAAIKGLGLGIGGTYGERKGSVQALGTLGRQSWLSFAGDTVHGQVWRAVPQLSWYAGSLGVVAEGAWSKQEVRQANSEKVDLATNAWLFSFSYFLTGEKNSASGIKARKSIDEGGFGVWELLGRIHGLHADFVEDDEILAYGLGWYPYQGAKLVASWEQSIFSSSHVQRDTRKPENEINLYLNLSL